MITSCTWLSRSPAALMRAKCAFSRSSSMVRQPTYPIPALRPPISWWILAEACRYRAPGRQCPRVPACRLPHVRSLIVSVLAALFHRLQGSHTAVHLVAAPLEQNGLAGTLIGAGKQAADHHRMGTGSDGLGQVAGKFDPAVGNERHPGFVRHFAAVHDGRHLGHPDAGHDAGGADRPGPDADLDGIYSPASMRSSAPLPVATFPAITSMSAEGPLFRVLNRIDHVFGVPVRGIDDNDIRTRIHQGRARSTRVLPHPDGGTGTQTPHAGPCRRWGIS
jgi:hypothetical protein